jgi:hypothetical protein
MKIFVLGIERLVQHFAHERFYNCGLVAPNAADDIQFIQDILDLADKVRFGGNVEERIHYHFGIPIQ